MKKWILNFIPCLGLLAALCCGSGCSDTINSVENARQVGVKNMVDDKRVITDTALNDKVNVIGINNSFTPAGFMRIRVDVLNRRSSTQHFRHLVEWFDANGMPVTTASGNWLQAEILGKQTLSLTAIAPNPSCQDFRIQMIDAE